MFKQLIFVVFFISLVFTKAEKKPCTGGFCTSYVLCVDGILNTDGTHIIDKRSVDNLNSECEDYLDVCCPSQSIKNVSQTINDEQVEFRATSSEKRCGNRNIVGLDETNVESTTSKFGEFPWMSSVLNKIVTDSDPEPMNLYRCGGALIHPQVVLTAAHCVAKTSIDTIFVRVGEWDSQTSSESLPHHDSGVTAVELHDEYKEDNLHNDIALLFLKENLTLAGNVQTICLPPQNYIPKSNNCAMSGWGKNIFGKRGRYQAIMKKTELPIVSRDVCSNALQNTRLGTDFQLHESFICAGGEIGKDSCTGDGGSPLVCPIAETDNQYYLAGSVSWGINCGTNVPGVYVNIPYFRNWIDSRFLLRGLSTTSYTA